MSASTVVRHWGALLGLGAILGLVGPSAHAATFGVPTNLNANGTTSATSVNPPGWFLLTGTASPTGNGDTVHQLRLFIEVTGTSLDVEIFDAGGSGARDILLGGAVTNTRYRIMSPGGVALCTITLGNDSATTQNRLARMSATNCAFTAANAGTAFTVAPGLYTLEVLRSGDTAANVFGVDVGDGAGNPYAAYTIGNSDANANVSTTETSMIVGAAGDTAPFGSVTNPMVMYPYVDSGCSIQTSNFDADSVGSASLTDTRGATTNLTISGGTVHSENTVTVETTTAANLESTNYGLYTLLNDTGTQQNLTDWRVADFSTWVNNPANLPRNATSPVRIYLPNGYAPVAGNPGGVPPVEPILAASTRVVSGVNPPVVGSATRFLITASVDNPAGGNTITNVQVTIPIVAGAAYQAGTQAGFVDGVSAACTDGSGAGFRRCTFASLAAGSVASLNIEVSYTPGVAGLQNLTGPPAAGSPPPNTTVWAQYTPVYTSVALVNETLGPVCNLVINVGGAAVATRATVRGVRVDRAGVVEFATAGQHDTTAFNVYETSDPAARTGRLLTPKPIPATIPDSDRPLLYRVETAAITGSHVLVEEIDRRGRRRLIGPFAVDDLRQGERLASTEARLDAEHAPRLGRVRVGGERWTTRGTPAERPRVWRRGGRTGVRIETAGAGRLEVSMDELQAAGLPAGTPTPRLRLATVGREVAFDVVPGPDGAPAALVFDADARATAYTGHNVYVLTWSGRPRPPAVALTPSGPAPAPGFVRVARSSIYVPNAPLEADPWQWDLLFGDGSSWPYDYDPAAGTFDLPDLASSAAGDVRVKVHLLGRSDHHHTVSADLDGVHLGEVSFAGAVTATIEGTVPADALRQFGNTLSVTYASDASPDDLGLVYLASADVAYPRDPARAWQRPVAVEPYDAVLPSLRGVEYLVITHPLFREQADRVAAIESARGHAAAVVETDAIYDAFSGGIPEANAVKAAIREAARGGRLLYVLLLGDDTFDTHDYLGTGAVAYVPSLLAWDGDFGRVPSENLYADLDGDSLPDVAIGRLPAQTVDQAAALVDKIASANPTHAPQTHLVVVDNQAPGDVSFRGEAEAAVAELPPGSAVTWADAASGVDAARATLLAGLGQGLDMTHYFGHAGPEVWADEGLLTVDDAAALAGSQRTTVLFTWACEAQWYQGLFGPSIGEALLLAPQGGVAASFGPAGITAPEVQRPLFLATYRQVFGAGLSLGEAVRRAKRDALSADPRTRPAVEGWNLLGDPALPLAPGAGARDRRGHGVLEGAVPEAGDQPGEARQGRAGGGRL